ncbi:ATP-binding cassette domain-containing protein [Bacillus sp. M6-12]|uniref:ATP-binding cassette domain-containing protein n=1 Tax=Bacillus sp. M6-12 TaxID=2054166 RepID=UPI0026CC6702|nr:ATP-binding cassette domain-containing protein [Bacillus sp. M6-12]
MERDLLLAENAEKKIDGTVKLSGISCTVQQNKAVALIGHNGSGKSSMLKLIAGIYEASSGKAERA